VSLDVEVQQALIARDASQLEIVTARAVFVLVRPRVAERASVRHVTDVIQVVGAHVGESGAGKRGDVLGGRGFGHGSRALVAPHVGHQLIVVSVLVPTAHGLDVAAEFFVEVVDEVRITTVERFAQKLRGAGGVRAAFDEALGSDGDRRPSRARYCELCATSPLATDE
jgi:hypothetical protein